VPDVGGLLVLGFESADHPVDAWIARAVEIARDHGGAIPDGVRASSRDGAAGQWRDSFIRAPYSRDALATMGLVVETFETACPWSRFDDLHASVVSAARDVIADVCGLGVVTCRFTHVYPDGPAPYFSVYAQGRWGDQVVQWDEVKTAVSEALHAAGGTITHHHAVGRDHRPWYDRQIPDVHRLGLRAAKAALDPAGILNPGVLLDP
jgi:alkyldihydroxyacetonephosphate synthase